MKKIVKITTLLTGLLFLAIGVYAADPKPSIDIEMATNDKDADYAPGPIIVIGDSVEWTYKVTNTGNVVLTGIGVIDTDKNGKITLITCLYNSLNEGEEMTCTHSGTAEGGQHKNLARVTTAEGVSDEDYSHYFGRDEDGSGGKASVNIKIGSNSGKPATINLKSHGKVPVAVFSETGFNASDIIPETVRFAGAAASHWNLANEGGNNELAIFHFPTQDLNLDQNSTTATLTGQTSEKYFAGTDSVRIVPQKPPKPPKGPKGPKDPKDPKGPKVPKGPKGPKK